MNILFYQYSNEKCEQDINDYYIYLLKKKKKSLEKKEKKSTMNEKFRE